MNGNEMNGFSCFNACRHIRFDQRIMGHGLEQRFDFKKRKFTAKKPLVLTLGETSSLILFSSSLSTSQHLAVSCLCVGLKLFF
jgi:hypothetical protein